MPDLHVVQNMPLLGRRLRLAGRLDVAIDWWMALFILGVVVVPSACFLSTVPFHPSLVGYYTTLGALLYSGILLAMACSSVLFLVITVVCDPGFVFPAGWSARRSDSVQSMEREFDPALDVHYCRVCQLFVEGFDHHCRVIGACIGKRNMWSFLLFCSSGAVMGALLAPFTVSLLWNRAQLPRSLPTTIPQLAQLVSIDVICALFVLASDVYGGGYCAGLCFLYWRRVFNDEHTVCRRKGGREKQIQASRRDTHKGFSLCPTGIHEASWKVVREVFAEYRTMELAAGAIDREFGK